MSLSFEEIRLKSPGVLKTRIPHAIFESIKSDVNEAIESKVPYNKNLVGNLAEEYEIQVKDYFKHILSDMFLEYNKRFDFCDEEEYYIPDNAWVNLQKKNEFNPIHHHDGSVSWVLWVNIPYYLEDEMQISSAVNSKNPSSSLFEFVYASTLGKVCAQSLYIDKFWEGNMIMFPAQMNHTVYPFFTSDDYRISIAGNIYTKGCPVF